MRVRKNIGNSLGLRALWNKAIAESAEEERRAGGTGALRAVSKCEREIA